ncbi:MAG: VWA domain-containing protein [Thermodesulfobacteriota bacterium]|nr:VWA domain-containing protein [Thermodesulfobacteriota bacterium]
MTSAILKMINYRRPLKKFLSLIFLPLVFSFTVSDALSGSFPQVVFIFDASGSMWGDAGGRKKIESAREVMGKVVPVLPSEVKIGLAAYGHRRKGDCTDIEILIPAGSTDKARLLTRVNSLSPKGKTPLADSVKMVVETLESMEEETTIVLISDGEETCHADPCGVVKGLKDSGIKFILHVVGFGVDGEQKEQLSCLAEAGGGQYLGADNADTLLSALETVKEDIVQKVEKAKTVTRKATTKLGKLRIRMPRTSTASLNAFTIRRVPDGKDIKNIATPGPDTTHTLLSGKYEVIAGFANSNYHSDSEVSFGIREVNGGETALIELGAMAIDIADSLRDIPAGAVIISQAGNEELKFHIPFTGNDYYFYMTKPLPAGRYDLAVHYKRTYLYNTSEKPVVLVSNILVAEGQESIVKIDSGITLKKPSSSPVAAWELIPAGTEEAIMRISGAFNGDYPLWQRYAVPPGTYDLLLTLEGMTEPLPAGEGITIGNSELLEFDAEL